MRASKGFVILVVILMVLPLNLFTIGPSTVKVAASSGPGFVFAASGDLNSPLQGTGYDSLRSLSALKPDCLLGLGDLSYDMNYTGTQWCKDLKSQFPNVEIIPGYH